jgi:hypothetical protein
VLESIAPLVYGEDTFIADFLQANAAGLTYADYMQLENYYRRQAARAAGLSAATARLLRSAMDLIFGFLPAELKAWIDRALAKDNLCAAPGVASGLYVALMLVQAGHRDHCRARTLPGRRRGARERVPARPA